MTNIECAAVKRGDGNSGVGMKIGLIGTDSSHAEQFLGQLNIEARHVGFTADAIWGADPVRNAALAREFAVDRVVPTPLAMLGSVDAVIVGDRHGGLHLEHALPFLKAGIPVLVDKPLACSLADAEAMLTAARRAGTMLVSASAVRWQPDVEALADRIAGLGGLRELIASGSFYPDSEYGGAFFYGIHTVELALELAGADFEAVSVEAGNPDLMVARCNVGTVRVRIRLVRPGADGKTSFSAEAICAAGNAAQPIRLGDDYMAPVLDRFIGMLRGKNPPLSDAQLLAPVRLMAAIDAAMY